MSDTLNGRVMTGRALVAVGNGEVEVEDAPSLYEKIVSSTHQHLGLVINWDETPEGGRT